MLKCDRCLRSIGLWLYKSETPQIINEEEEEKENPLHDEMIFANTQPYSDEIAVKNVLVRMVNQVEIEQENLALSRLSNKPLKRKLSDIDLNEQSSERKEAGTSREFDPIREHFNWCPWLAQQRVDKCLNEEKIERNTCLVCYEVICRKLQTYVRQLKQQTSVSSSSSSPSRPAPNQNTDQLIDRIKCVQSLLINCASKYNLKST